MRCSLRSGLLLLIFAASPTCAVAQSCAVDTVVYFANGVLTEKKDATTAALRIQRALGSRIPTSELCRYEFGVKYNQSENLLVDILESARQTIGNEYPTLAVAGLLGLLGIDNSVLTIVVPDGAIQEFNERLRSRAVQEFLAGDSSTAGLDEHVDQYVSELSGKRGIVVAHSQGNIFANMAAQRLENEQPDTYSRFAIVPVASPEYFVLKSLVGHVRFADDLVILAAQVAKERRGLPGPLDANDEDNFDVDRWSHRFIEAYLLDDSARQFILAGIQTTSAQLPQSTVPAVLFSDGFEPYVSGTFPATGGWFIRPGAGGIGAASQFVTSSHAHAGAHSFQLESAAGLGINVQKLLAPSATPLTHKLAVEAYVNTTSAMYKNAFIGFGTEGNLSAVVRLMAGGTLAAADLTPLAGSYHANAWIRLRVEIDPSTNRYDVSVNGLRAESSFPILGAAGAIDRVWIGVDNSGVGGLAGTVVYVDDVSLSDLNP